MSILILSVMTLEAFNTRLNWLNYLEFCYVELELQSSPNFQHIEMVVFSLIAFSSQA